MSEKFSDELKMLLNHFYGKHCFTDNESLKEYYDNLKEILVSLNYVNSDNIESKKQNAFDSCSSIKLADLKAILNKYEKVTVIGRCSTDEYQLKVARELMKEGNSCFCMALLPEDVDRKEVIRIVFDWIDLSDIVVLVIDKDLTYWLMDVCVEYAKRCDVPVLYVKCKE